MKSTFFLLFIILPNKVNAELGVIEPSKALDIINKLNTLYYPNKNCTLVIQDSPYNESYTANITL